MRCINCDLNLYHSRRLLVFELDTRTISMIAEWIAPIIVTETDYVCQQCWEAAMRAINESLPTIATANDDHPSEASSSSNQQQQRLVGHSRVCITCGRSVLRFPSELVVRTNPTARQQQIQQLISNNIAPQEVHSSDRLCHNCYRAAGCKVARMHSQTPNRAKPEQQVQEATIIIPTVNETFDEIVTSQPSSPSSSGSEWLPANMRNVPQETTTTITLPNYKRAIGSPGNCAIFKCNNKDTHTISEALRIRLLKDYKLYLPTHIRICSEHLLNNEWETLHKSGTSSFTSQQIEHVFSFLNHNESYNFEEILNIDNNLFQYWMGLTRENFLSILDEVPSLCLENMKTGLAALLIESRNGYSDERIASLMSIPRHTLEGYMTTVRRILTEEFVPKHLGLPHITRQQMSSPNLLVPNDLYGHSVKPIFVWDGNYTFTNS